MVMIHGLDVCFVMQDARQMPPYQLPVEIAADLRPYQREGISWLAFLRRSGLHGVLADDMGAPCAMRARRAPCETHRCGAVACCCKHPSMALVVRCPRDVCRPRQDVASNIHHCRCGLSMRVRYHLCPLTIPARCKMHVDALDQGPMRRAAQPL